MQKNGRKNGRKKGIGKKAGPVLLAVLLILIAGGAFLVQRYMPTRERMDKADYFGILAENEVAVVLQDHLAEQRGILEGDSLYLNYEMVRDYLNSRFYWDEGNQQMLFTTALETYEIPVNSQEYTIDGVLQQYDKMVLFQKDGGLYVSIDFLAQYTNMEYTLVQEEDSRHVLIRYQWGMQKTAEVRKSTVLRYLGGIKSPVLTEANKGDTVQVLEELENWSKVVTSDGYVGYISNRYLENIQETEVTREFQEPEYSSMRRDKKIQLVWHQIDYQEANAYLLEDISGITGVNVISPTWFSVTDNEGNISSLASEEYVQQAHDAGLEIWGLVSNFSADVNTATLLASTQARRKMVNYLVDEALRLGIEGINLDFEYIREECGYSYVQFVRELSIACRKNQLVFSIDVPVPMDFNLHFNRKELGTVADYIIIMGYDEHYVGSETAGSVASIGFEENGIIGTLEDVPAEKIISGVPFYTRIWYTVTDAEGTTHVNSEAIGMDTVDRTLETYGVTPVWYEETAQYYAAWTTEDGVLCEIWMEEEESLARKARLVSRYGLGGIAAWVLGFERSSVWEVLSKNI